jgi:hypothetical protein
MKLRSGALHRKTPAVEIAGVSKLGTDELRERWKAICGKALPREIGRSFLARAITYRLPPPGAGVRRTQTLDLPLALGAFAFRPLGIGADLVVPSQGDFVWCLAVAVESVMAPVRSTCSADYRGISCTSLPLPHGQDAFLDILVKSRSLLRRAIYLPPVGADVSAGEKIPR